MTAISAGQSIEVTIESLSSAGEGIAYRDGRPIIVSGAFIGERLRVVIDHVGKRQSFATLAFPVDPHADRRIPPCARHPGRGGECSGCAWQGLRESAQRQHKRRLLAAVYGLEVDAMRSLPGADLGYRWSSKRVVGGRPGALVLGSYVRGSHGLADMSGCLVEHATIRAAADELVAIADELEIEPYRPGVFSFSSSSSSSSGDLRYVWFKTDGERVLLTLITGGRQSRAATLLGERLRLPSGVAWSVQDDPGNAIRGHDAVMLRGRGSLSLTIAGRQVEVGPLGFLQPNPAVAALAYRDLICDHEGLAGAGELALDLYAGAGVTTSQLRRAYTRVIPVESYPESAQALGTRPQSVAEFLAEYRGVTPDLVVANPPRSGLGNQVCRRLCELGAARLQLMSCSPRSLARDLAALEGSGYERVALRAYDTLPQTPHVELVVWLRRSS
ncbi:MAG TPA: class I SAM-dependent RNA methyltransferase [Nannocystis exedens]|nr:class I SAM-dependent RNA methyltransferase [Nannocystis exedens]